jgi:dipeptidyl aminopeptidase/acylaminoacyl peptidase
MMRIFFLGVFVAALTNFPLSISCKNFYPEIEVSVAIGATPLIADPGAVIDGEVLEIEQIDSGAPNLPTDSYRLRYRSDGLAIVGYLILPRDRQQNLPILLFAHGGAGDSEKIGAPVLRYLSNLAAKGHFLILATDYRGTSPSEGQDEYGGADVDDVINLIPIAAKLPVANINDVFMLGFSRGAIDTYVAIGKGVSLRAAAIVSGPTDLGLTHSKLGFFTQRRISNLIGGSPDTKPDAYRARSPLAWPEKLNVPLLILHGAKDDRIAAGDVEALDHRLTELGKPHKMVLFPDGNHMLHNKSEQRDEAIISWFGEHLNH